MKKINIIYKKNNTNRSPNKSVNFKINKKINLFERLKNTHFNFKFKIDKNVCNQLQLNKSFEFKNKNLFKYNEEIKYCKSLFRLIHSKDKLFKIKFVVFKNILNNIIVLIKNYDNSKNFIYFINLFKHFENKELLYENKLIYKNNIFNKFVMDLNKNKLYTKKKLYLYIDSYNINKLKEFESINNFIKYSKINFILFENINFNNSELFEILNKNDNLFNKVLIKKCFLFENYLNHINNYLFNNKMYFK